MNIAFVGWTNSDIDCGILLDCYKILQSLKLTSYDFIDLNRDRDFLKENKRYDIVVLIYIFILSQEEMINEQLYSRNDHFTKTSELHSQENWRKRLLNTEAEEILIFGYDPYSEVSGKYIGELEKYKYSEIELIGSKGIYGKVWRYSYSKDT